MDKEISMDYVEEEERLVSWVCKGILVDLW